MISRGVLTDLGTTPVAETLRTIAVERRSGDLQVQSGKAVKTLFFDHGRIVFAASNLRKDRLGEALVALGRITDEEYTRASALLGGERKRRFGEALISAGIMDKTELGRSVARQVNRIVLSNTVVDHEKVIRRAGGDTFEVAAIYTIAGDKIARVDFVNPT